MRLKVFVGIACALVVIGVATSGSLFAQNNADLSKKVADLERKLAALEQRVEAMAPPSPEMENQARAALNQIQALMGQGKHEQAKAQMQDFKKKYAKTSSMRQAQSIDRELSVFGKAAPAKWGIEKWYQGESAINLGNDATTLLVFWEEWCPHCKREVPKMQEMYEKLKPSGLQMIGVTKITRSSTEEKVKSFVKSQKVDYPIAKEDGSLSTHFGVSGIPAAAVVKDGKVVWRGHPARLTEQMLKGWL